MLLIAWHMDLEACDAGRQVHLNNAVDDGSSIDDM